MKKFTIIGFTVVALIMCALLFWRHAKQPTDSDLRQKLSGTWAWERDNIRCTNTIAPNGTFDYQLVYLYAKDARTHQVEGTWQVEDGILIETITNDNDAQHRVPRTNSAQIILVDARELSVAYQHFTNTETWKRISQ
jgi:hypothetical protein